MEAPDWPVHSCYATCNDLSYLLAEVAALTQRAEQQQSDIDYLLETQRDQLARADKLIQRAEAAERERDQLREREAKFIQVIDEQGGWLSRAHDIGDQLRAENQRLREVRDDLNRYIDNHLSEIKRLRGLNDTLTNILERKTEEIAVLRHMVATDPCTQVAIDAAREAHRTGDTVSADSLDSTVSTQELSND